MDQFLVKSCGLVPTFGTSPCARWKTFLTICDGCECAAYQRKCDGYSQGQSRRRHDHRVSHTEGHCPPPLSQIVAWNIFRTYRQMVQKRDHGGRSRQYALKIGRWAIITGVSGTRRDNPGGNTFTARALGRPPTMVHAATR